MAKICEYFTSMMMKVFPLRQTELLPIYTPPVLQSNLERVDTTSYAFVFGGKSTDKAKADPKNVFLFHEDFSNSTLSRDWKRVWGEWDVKNGRLFGKTGRSPYGNGEVGLYLKEGKGWGDIEVQLDLMETGTGTVYPGPFLRVQESGLQHTTAWWFEYWTDHKECTMRPFVDNKDGGWKYRVSSQNHLLKTSGFVLSTS